MSLMNAMHLILIATLLWGLLWSLPQAESQEITLHLPKR